MNATTKLKSVDYSYPSSPNAVRFGFKNGCYCVSIGELNKPAKAVAAFATQLEAQNHADSLPNEWSKLTMVATCFEKSKQ